jgi:hypothetical protein
MLAEMATEESSQEIDDCYFLVDDPAWNAKVRDNTLKIKQLVDEEKGFEVWTSNWVRAAKTAPAPFASLFDDLNLDRHARGKSYDISRAVAELDPKSEATAVFVTKLRRRYRIGSIRAEVTDITIESSGEVLRTLAIEGDDLDDLVALRKKLGLRGSENIAVHVAIGEAT